MLFENAYKKYLELGTSHLKKQTLETFWKNFNLHVMPYFKGFDIFELTKLDYLKWKNTIISMNYSNSFNNNLYVCFNQFIQFCCDYLDLSCNYLKEIGNFKRKYELKKYDYYTLDEFNLFISGVDDYMYKLFFTFLFFTGARPGEAMALKFSDLIGNYIYINHNLTTKGGRELDTPKNISSYREIVIDDYLVNELCNLKEYYINLYGDECFDYYIFGGFKPLAPTTINRVKLKACSKANIRTITLHQFRHSHATLLVNEGIPINDVSKRLGHSKISTTLDIYVHCNLEQEKRVLSTLNSLRLNILEKI